MGFALQSDPSRRLASEASPLRWKDRGTLNHRAAAFAPPALVAFISFVGPAARAEEGAAKSSEADVITKQLDPALRQLDARNKVAKEKEAKARAGNDPTAAAAAAAEAERAATAKQTLAGQLKSLSDYEHGEHELKGKVTGGFDGQEAKIRGQESDAEPQQNYKVNSGIELTRGTYPQEFKASATVGVLLSGKKFQEDVSTLKFTYDHFAEPAVELYGFAERLSDSYLSIDQRWEVGGGVYVGWRTGLTKAGAKAILPLCSDPALHEDLLDDSRIRRLNGWSATTRNCLPSRAAGRRARTPRVPDTSGSEKSWNPVVRAAATELFGSLQPPVDSADPKRPEEPIEAWYRLAALREKAIRSIEQVSARAAIGVAVSVLSEIERSTIKVMVGDQVKSVTLDGEQVFRLSVRPTIRLRPSNHVYLELLSYFKWKVPFSKSDALDAAGEPVRRTDLRVDAHAEARYILAGAETLGGEKFSLVASYDLARDNAPPFLSHDLLVAQGITDRTGGVAARREHHTFRMQLAVGWGS